MCRFADHVNHRRADGRYAAEAYPAQNQVIPYNQVQAGVCPVSGRHLSHNYIHNSGQTEKMFHEDVYQGIIRNRTNTCRMCRAKLSRNKVSAQNTQPREISNHFCDECIQYLALINRKVAGFDNSFLLDERSAPQIEYVPIRPAHNDPNVIDAEYVEHAPSRIHRLPAPEPRRTMNDWMNQTTPAPRFEYVPIKKR